MVAFWRDVVEFTFLQRALIAGLLASVACGIVGSYVVVRRTTYIAGAISHCVLAGMAAARYLRSVHGVEFTVLSGTITVDGQEASVALITVPTPLQGAAVVAVLAALVVGLVTRYGEHRQDTVLSVIWALGMAIGITFIAQTPGYNQDLMSYLFGDILMVARGDLWLMAALDILIVIVILLFYNKLLAVSFDEELARLRGIRVGVYQGMLLVVTALTVVLLVQVVGIVMVIALLALPAAAAGHLTRRLGSMMIVAVLLSALFTVGGIALSYGPELPAGATIIELAGLGYVAVLLGRYVTGRLRSGTQSGGPSEA